MVNWALVLLLVGTVAQSVVIFRLLGYVKVWDHVESVVWKGDD